MAKDQRTPAQRKEIEARAATLVDDKENWATRQAEREMAVKQAARTHRRGWLLLLIGGPLAAWAIVYCGQESADNAARARHAAEATLAAADAARVAADAARVAALPPEKRAAEEKKRVAQAEFAAKAADAAAAAGDPMTNLLKFSPVCQVEVKHHLRDPDSVTFDYPATVTHGAKGWGVRETFRARNGFGGMNRGSAVCKLREDGTLISAEVLAQ